MKKISLLFLLSLSFSLSATAATLKNIQSSGVLRIATEGAFEPFNYYVGGKLSGFEVELGDEIAKTMGVKTEWKTMAFGILFIGLDQDRYDLVISSHARTPEREKQVQFVAPHYCSGGVIVAKKDGPQTTAALAGKRVAVQSNSIYPAFLTSFPSIKEVKSFQKDEDSIHALIADSVDAVVTEKFLARELVKKSKNENLQVSGIVNPEKNAMAVAKGNSGLKNEVEKALKLLMKNGVYGKLSKKYFGEDIRCK